ncbi:CsbD family protein [Levilactobacillus fuyuanensis]|uniref:CsbD family protein n=1 Tax=Levilactobacillus fuyuanensis TaxID=2486022 RepID=A0ABW4H1N5_9LACO|nr:CsbD family protein [Levilactobacillus fuyuanensis]
MKNLLLGFSLAANVALAYLVLQDKEQLKALQSRADNAVDKVAGKAQQIKGTLTGDVSAKAKGNLQEGRGEVKDIVDDVKAEFGA